MNSSVLCIGVANVDIIAHVDTGFLLRHRIDKGTSTLMRSYDILTLIGELQNPAKISGGCAANTACGVGKTGIDTAFVGMIHRDCYGEFFQDSFKPYNVTFHPCFHPEKSTSLCVTLVTSDKERSFVFSPDAASWFLSDHNLPEKNQQRPLIVYTEANLFRMTAGTTQQSMLHSVVARYSGPDTQIILNLIDTEITTHQRQAIREMMTARKLAYIICNCEELMTLFSTDKPQAAFESACASGQAFLATLGKEGVMIIGKNQIEKIDAIFVPHEDIQDLIGAGDQFAAGFIAGLAQGKSLKESCRQGILSASAILLVPGARPIAA